MEAGLAPAACLTCGHPHLESDKCKDGTDLFGRHARTRGPTNAALHFVAADLSSLPAPKFREHLLLATILRKQVFVEELGLAEPAFELAEGDQAWRHVFAQRGDAPLGYIRWRVHSNPASCKPVYGLVEMLAVAARARRQGIAKRLIGYCIQDIAVRLMDRSEFIGMFAIIPREPVCIPQTFVRMGFRFVPPETPLPDGLVCPPPEQRELVMLCPLDIMAKILETLASSDPAFREPHDQAHKLPAVTVASQATAPPAAASTWS